MLECLHNQKEKGKPTTTSTADFLLIATAGPSEAFQPTVGLLKVFHLSVEPSRTTIIAPHDLLTRLHGLPSIQ